MTMYTLHKTRNIGEIILSDIREVKRVELFVAWRTIATFMNNSMCSLVRKSLCKLSYLRNISRNNFAVTQGGI
jgi:hypothetical protein